MRIMTLGQGRIFIYGGKNPLADLQLAGRINTANYARYSHTIGGGWVLPKDEHEVGKLLYLDEIVKNITGKEVIHRGEKNEQTR